MLRDEWGYKYWVTSDAGATDRLCDAFKLCRSSPIDSEAITLATLPAGNDVEMGGGSLYETFIPSAMMPFFFFFFIANAILFLGD